MFHNSTYRQNVKNLSLLVVFDGHQATGYYNTITHQLNTLQTRRRLYGIGGGKFKGFKFKVLKHIQNSV